MAKKGSSQEGFEILEGLDGLRANPTMYLGDLGSAMVGRAIKEVVDNSYDEFVAGRNNAIEVTVDLDTDWIVVSDAAGGVPTDFKKLKGGTKISILEAAFTRTHAGGKFNNKAYKTSAGTHGIGVSAVNAVSEQLVVYSMYRGQCALLECEKGETKNLKLKGAKVDSLTKNLLSKSPAKYGTIVRFKLDQAVVSESVRRGQKLPKSFKKAVPDIQEVGVLLRNIAYLNPGLTITFRRILKRKLKESVFLNKKGLPWIPKNMIEARELAGIGKPLVHKSDTITCAVQWADHPDVDNFLTFVNTSPTIDGGYHVTGFMTALSQVLKPFMKKTKKGSEFASKDLLIGLTGMFVWRMHGAQYHSQVKDKLVSRVDREVHEEMLPVLTEYFKKNKSVGRAIIRRAEAMTKGRKELAAAVKSLTDVKKASRASALPASLEVAPRCKPEERELYLVEGDSAAGEATNARDPHYQEILKAKGKPLNALNATIAKILSSEEVQNFLIALGADLKTLNVKAENPSLSVDNLRVQNVVFLTDPDPDGGHIAVLYLAVIYRLLPDLLRQGRVWAVRAPLFAVLKDGKVFGGNTMDEALKAAPWAKARDVTRIKGWGEVNADWIEPLAFREDTRHLVQISYFPNTDTEKFFRGVVGEDAVFRRQLLGLEG